MRPRSQENHTAQNNLSRIYLNTPPDMYTMEMAIRAFTDPTLGHDIAERVPQNQRLMIAWHILSMNKSDVKVSPALATYLVAQPRETAAEPPEEKLALDKDSTWKKWLADVEDALCLTDRQLLESLELLQKNHGQIYGDLLQIDDRTFPLDSLPFTAGNIRIIQNKLGVNLHKLDLDRHAPGMHAMVAYRRLLDRLRRLAQTPHLNGIGNLSESRASDTLFAALCKNDLPHFASLMQAGADPNATIDDLPLYYLTLQPHMVKGSLKFFNVLAEDSQTRLNDDVFDMLLNFEARQQDFQDAVQAAVRKCGPLSLESWQNILRRKDLADKQHELAQFAHAMIPQMECQQTGDAHLACQIIRMALDPQNQHAPELTAAFLDLTPLLTPTQREGVARAVTECFTSWNAELFRQALKFKLVQLNGKDPEDLVEFILRERIKRHDAATQDTGRMSAEEDGDEDRDGDGAENIPRDFQIWVRRMIQAHDDETLCTLVMQLMTRQLMTSSNVTWFMGRIFDQLEDCQDDQLVANLCKHMKRGFASTFQKALKRLEASQLMRLMTLDIVKLEDLNDEALVQFIANMQEEDIGKLMEQGANLGPKCLAHLAAHGMLRTLRGIIQDTGYLAAHGINLDAVTEQDWGYGDNAMFQLILGAINAGQSDMLDYLLTCCPAMLESRDHYGNSLIMAVLNQRSGLSRRSSRANVIHYQNCLRTLLKAMGPDCVNLDGTNGTPICVAAEQDNLPAIQLLLQEHADPNGGAFSREGPALFRASDPEVIRCLRQHGATPAIKDREGNYPLLNLTTAIPFQDFKRLLDDTPEEYLSGANADNKTLLHTYVYLLTQLNRERRSMKAEKEKYMAYLPQLIRDFNLDVNAITRERSSYSFPLAIALQHGDRETAAALLNLGADVRQLNPRGEGILFTIAELYNIEKAMECFKTAVETYGLNPADCNYLGQNVLFRLCDENHRPLFDYACQHGASVHQVDHDGFSLLYMAAHQENLALVQDLLAQGAKPMDPDDCTLIEELLYIGKQEDVPLNQIKEMFRKCLDAGLPVDAPGKIHTDPALFSLMNDVTPRTLDLLRFFLDELHVGFKVKNDDGETLLHELMLYYDVANPCYQETFDYLMQKPELNFKVSMKSNDGNTLLHSAAANRNYGSTPRTPLWQKLCDYNPNLPRERNRDGETPFHAWIKECARNFESDDDTALMQELFFWLQDKTPDETVNCQGQNALEIYLSHMRDDAPLTIIQELCQCGYVCNDLRCFACVRADVFDWYFKNVLKEDSTTLIAMMDQEMREHDDNIFTMALINGNADLVLLLMNCGYSIWDRISTRDFLSSLYKGEARNIKILDFCFNRWHWNPQLLRECYQDEQGNTRNALDLFFECSPDDDRLGILKMLSEQLLPNTYTYQTMLNRLTEEAPYDCAKTLEWLVGKGADPFVTPNAMALTTILSNAHYSPVWDRMLQQLGQYVKDRNQELPMQNEPDKKTTLIHEAIRNNELFFLRKLLETLHVRIGGTDSNGMSPIGFAVHEEGKLQLYWLLEQLAQSQELTPEFLSHVLSLAIEETNASQAQHGHRRRYRRHGTNLEIIIMLIERFHAAPNQPDETGRIPISDIPSSSPLWNYLNASCRNRRGA